MKGDTYSKLAEILSSILDQPIDSSQLNDGVDLILSLGLTSLDMLQLIIQIEEKFSLQIDIAQFDLKLLNNSQQLCLFIERIKADNKCP